MESSESSGSEEEDLPVPVSQKVGDTAFSSVPRDGICKTIVQPLNATTALLETPVACSLLYLSPSEKEDLSFYLETGIA